MRKGRFEDQRGTEICFEIPEFLRLPENTRYEEGILYEMYPELQLVVDVFFGNEASKL